MRKVNLMIGIMFAPFAIVMAALMWPTPPQKNCGVVMKLEVTQQGQHKVWLYVPSVLKPIVKTVKAEKFYQIKEGQELCLELTRDDYASAVDK